MDTKNKTETPSVISEISVIKLIKVVQTNKKFHDIHTNLQHLYMRGYYVVFRKTFRFRESLIV